MHVLASKECHLLCNSPAVGMEAFEEQAYGKQEAEEEDEGSGSSGAGSCSSGGGGPGNGQEEEEVDEKDVLELNSKNCEGRRNA
jgi:hypothetical protein